MTQRRQSGGSRVLHATLGVPLFFKLLVANSVIVIAGAVAGTWLTAEFVRAQPQRSTIELVGWLAVVGTLLSVAVNALIIRLALVPVDELERTANAIRAGDLDARARVSPLADRDFRRLTKTFNAMLDQSREHRGLLRRMASLATNAAEAERKRIARDLHDGTAQTLAALLIQVRVLAEAQDTEERRAQVASLREHLARALEEVRGAAHALRPEALEELGPGAAVQRHARRLEPDSGAKIDVRWEPSDLRPEPEVELAAYRIVQEALTNAARHAGASRITVRARQAGDAIEILVEDDGRGFDVERVMAGRDRLGLFGMRERAEYLGGRLDVRSRPGEGTTVQVVLPLSAHATPFDPLAGVARQDPNAPAQPDAQAMPDA